MPAARRPPADRRARRRSEAAGDRRERAARRERRTRSERDGTPRRRSDLLARILVAIPAAILAIAFVDLGGTAWAILMIGVACACLYELYALLSRWRPSPVVGFASAIAMVLAARFSTDRAVLEVAMATLPVAFLIVIARGAGGVATVSIAGTLLGVYWIGLAFAHAELLRRLPHGGGILIDIMVGTFLGDTFAYVGGRLFGRRPLASSISPHKTFEGLVCGMLVAILAVFVAGLNQPWLTQGDALILGLTVAVLGPVGDLFESMVKRDAGAKDAGRLFGAHGGALDRLDAVIFTVVAGYYVWLALLH
ncbi:MAG TPA: phosphatidate cytidylyltransferase [Solirubrobacteraceae bacterium]|jgi:phosphatidate cytidylyltransferase|nr:phosphatidate cytidylyltransferase [Solirubrobacteraceae bacterium]